MEVEEDDGRHAARLLHESVDDLPRRDRRVEEELSEEVEHRDPHAVPRLDDRHPAARRQCALVCGADDALARGEVAGNPAAAVRVVAERHDVCAGGEELVGELRRDPYSVGNVLAVDDREVGVVALAERRQFLLHGAAAGGADDVCEKEEVQPAATTGAARTSIATWLPPLFVYCARACCSTLARSTTVPSFVAPLTTALPTVRAGSAVSCVTATTREDELCG